MGNWDGIRVNTMIMILGDLARANEDRSDSDREPFEWRLDPLGLIAEIERYNEWLKGPATL